MIANLLAGDPSCSLINRKRLFVFKIKISDLGNLDENEEENPKEKTKGLQVKI